MMASNAEPELSAELRERIKILLYEHSGVSKEFKSSQMLESWLADRMRVLQMVEARAYMDYVESDAAEADSLVNAITIHETRFFRTERVWTYMEQELFLTWALRPDASRNIWSAACSTGEESYSLLMAVHSYNLDHETKLETRVLGTDISADVLSDAKAGLYSGRSIRALESARPDFFERYFRQQGQQYKIKKKIGSRVIFRQHNLLNRPIRRNHFDMVMLRNVLIYFNKKDKEKALANAYKAMKPGGILIVGESESLSDLDTDFDFVQPLIYQKNTDV